MSRRLGEHDIATCGRLVSRRLFADRRAAEAWVDRTAGTTLIHQVRATNTTTGQWEVKYCLRADAAPPRRRFR